MVKSIYFSLDLESEKKIKYIFYDFRTFLRILLYNNYGFDFEWIAMLIFSEM